MEQENYPLDEATIAYLADIKLSLDKQALAVQAKHQGQYEGALNLFIRQQGLQGNWQVAENGRELVRAPAPVPAETP